MAFFSSLNGRRRRDRGLPAFAEVADLGFSSGWTPCSFPGYDDPCSMSAMAITPLSEGKADPPPTSSN